MTQVLVFPLTLAATIAVLVTLRLTNGQLRYTRAAFRKSVKDSAEDRRAADRSRVEASAAADRAENAARGTIDALDRVAQQVEAVATRLPLMARSAHVRLSGEGSPGVGGAGGPLLLPPLPQRAEWSMTHYKGDTYQLENVGAGAAFEVRIDHDPTLLFPQGEFDEPTIGGHEARIFMAFRTMGTRDSTLTVSWQASPDAEDREVWRYPLPPKP